MVALTARPGEWPQSGGDALNTARAQGPASGLHLPPQYEARLGEAVSSAVTAAARVAFVAPEDRLVVRTDGASGPRWSRPLRAPSRAPDLGYTASTPAIEGDVVCVGSRGGAVQAFDLNTGEPVWSVDVGAQIRSSPTVTDGTVFIGDDAGGLHAIDVLDGTLRWTARAGSYITSAPAVAHGIVYATSYDGYVHAFHAATGEPRWRAVTQGGIGSPCVAGGRLLAGSEDTRLYCLDARNGERIWRRRVEDSINEELAVSADVVVVSAGSTVQAIRLPDGRPSWATTLGSDGSASIVGQVVLIAADRRLHALGLDNGGQLWQVPLPGRARGAPVVVPGGVLVTAGGVVDLFTIAEADDGAGAVTAP